MFNSKHIKRQQAQIIERERFCVQDWHDRNTAPLGEGPIDK